VIGQFQEGWAEYERRLEKEKLAKLLGRFSVPLWDGSALDGRRLCVVNPQGIGDCLMFCRCLNQLTGGPIVVEVQESLVSLIQENFPLVTVVGRPEEEEKYLAHPVPESDLVVPICSLPHRLGLGQLDGGPYLSTETEFNLPPTDRKKVGFVFSGNPSYPNDHFRSCPLSYFAALIRPDVQLYSLQVNPREIGGFYVDCGPWLDSWQKTAAAVKELDLVVCCDTAIAHLAGAMAGAMAVPCWVLLPHSPDWRWGLRSCTTALYPSVRLIRCPSYLDWEGCWATVSGMYSIWK
jgi:hypothetical protein